MYIKYSGMKTFFSDGAMNMMTAIVDMSQVFSVEVSKQTKVYDNRKDGKIYRRSTEEGSVTIYKTDKTFHQFYFKSWKNVDEFISQVEKCLGKDRGESIVLIEIEHETTPVKEEILDSFGQKLKDTPQTKDQIFG